MKIFSEITIGIISFNSENNLNRLFSSLEKFPKIIFIDNGSADKSVMIAKKYGAKIFIFLEKDQRKLREYALGKCETEWMLFIDTDEIINNASFNNILKVWNINKNKYDGFWIPRRNYFGSNEEEYLKYGLFYPDYQLRLIRKNIKYKNTPHEEPDIGQEHTLKIIDAYITHLFDKKKLLHPFGFIKLLHFTRSYAKYLIKEPIINLIFKSLIRFVDLTLFSLIRGKGILDGWRGILASWNFGIHISSIYLYAIYLKVVHRK